MMKMQHDKLYSKRVLVVCQTCGGKPARCGHLQDLCTNDLRICMPAVLLLLLWTVCPNVC